MKFGDKLLLRAFGRPEGIIGRIGGWLMLRGKDRAARRLLDILDLPEDALVLEIGCGPGALLRVFADAVPLGHVVGLDPSSVMLGQARRRNALAIARGRVALLEGEAESVPAPDGSFDVVVAINSLQFWRDRLAGFRECRRLLRTGGRVVIGFTSEARLPAEGWEDDLRTAGLGELRTAEGEGVAWTLARVC